MAPVWMSKDAKLVIVVFVLSIVLRSFSSPFFLFPLVFGARQRLQRFGDCRDAPEIWGKAGLPQPERIAEISDNAFLAIQRMKEADHDAR
jgi:hypothetical protein